MQFGIVLKMLRKEYPGCHITLETKPNREAVFRHLVDELLPLQYPFDVWAADLTKYIQFGIEHKGHYGPSTKVYRCLNEEFNIFAEWEDYTYSVSIHEQALGIVDTWYEQIARPVVVVHYEGISCPERKNLPRQMVAAMCARLIDGGATPLILDWGLNKIADGQTILTAKQRVPQTSDYVAALIDRATAFIGIDSGPAHLAGATETPSHVVWTKFFPAYNYDIADNVIHHLGEDTWDICRNPDVKEFFRDYYYHQEYADLETRLMSIADDVLERT